MSYLLKVWAEKVHDDGFTSDQPSLQLAIEKTKRCRWGHSVDTFRTKLDRAVVAVLQSEKWAHGLNLARLPINTFCRRATAAHLTCSAGCAAVRVGGDEYPRESFATK
eukprot:2507346-Amphidinium_carterae.1